MPLVLADRPEVLEALGGGGVDKHALQVVVDLGVGDAERLLVGKRRAVLFEVGGGHLLVEALIGLEVGEKLRALAFVQAGERDEVGCAVTEFSEKARDVLRCVVGANDEQAEFARDRVLGDHAHARFDIALVEVAELLLVETVRDFARERRRCGLDIDGDALVRLDEVERELRVVLVRLDAVGETDRDERGLAPLLTGLLHRELRELARQRRVLAARNTEDEPFRACLLQVVDEEVDAPGDLAGGRDERLHAERSDDLLLRRTDRVVGRVLGQAVGGGVGLVRHVRYRSAER